MGLNQRHKVLLSAYACEPNKGSEPGVGWNWATHLAEKYEVYVITRLNNKKVIESYLVKHPIEHLHFYYHDCSELAKKLKKMPNGIFLYYKKWQSEILSLATKIVCDEQIELVHHITFNEFRTPGKLYKIDKPFVWGPIGGGQFYNPIFKNAYFSKKDIIKEKFRNFINEYYLHFSADIKNTVCSAKAILIADQSTEKVMPKSRKYIRLLETAYNTDRNTVKTYNEKSPKDMLNLLWVGGIWPRKGLKLLIDALGNSDFKDYDLKIIGDGNDKSSCIALVKKYGLEDKVHFLGKMSYEKVNMQYDVADVFIFTSLRDTSGNVVLEAMSHGLPVIALDHHGVGEIVTNETGYKIIPKNYNQIMNDIIKGIQMYKKRPELIEEQGREGRKRIETVYSWDYNLKHMSEVYDRILEGNK